MRSWREPLLAAMLAGSLGHAQAVVALPGFELYTDAGDFLSATGISGFESFESQSARARGTAAVVASAFSITPLGLAQLGVQDGPDSPEPGYGAQATHGTHYLLSYLPPEPGTGTLRAPGTLRFDFQAPVTAFGIRLVDLGEASGEVQVKTDAGALSGGETVLSFAGGLGSGNRSFVGVVQGSAFRSLSLTVTGLDEAYGLDQAYVLSVPEPQQALLMAAGLVPLLAAARRRRAR